MARPRPLDAAVSVPMPDQATIRSVIGEAYDPQTALHITEMFAGTEEFFPALIGMVRAVFGTADIDARHREVIVLRAAALLNVAYEWQANERMARNAGLTSAHVDALAADGPVTGIEADLVLLATATDEMLTNATLTDATLERLLDTFGAVVTRKYIVTIGWFSLLSLFINATRVPLETTDKIGHRVSPLG